jgi:O-antigen/teichoic acid export membrane protein
LAIRFLSYGMPIIFANILYQSTPLLNRVLVSQTLGFAEAGQLSLAFEIGVRIIGAIGSALDVILFQIAVRAEKTIGAEGAREQVSRNMGVVFAVVIPAVTGCWLILPSFESLFVPQNFQGPFARYFTLMIPALTAFALINYALNPAYQIAHRLPPLIIGALVAVLVNLLAIGFLPAQGDATIFALAQSLSSLAGMVALSSMLFMVKSMWPRAKDILGTVFSASLMFAAVLPLRGLAPGPIVMAAQIALGAAVYLGSAAALDLAGVRTLLRPKIPERAKG